MSVALLIVDLQPDFLPGGALAVPDGDAVLAPIRRLLEERAFDVAVATQHWHPPGHISFASSHPGHALLDVIELYGRPQTLWPDHCVQGTPGAELHRDMPWSDISAIIRKGTDPGVDSYSTFRNNWNADGHRPRTGLAGYLRERAIDEVVLCGLARDFCVKWSAEDAVDAGFRTTVLWNATRPVFAADDEEVRRALLARGVTIA